MSDEEGYLLCIDLFDSCYSEEDIAEFVMRKFLKNGKDKITDFGTGTDGLRADKRRLIKKNLWIKKKRIQYD